MFVRKKDVPGIGSNYDASKLTKYNDNDYIIDDDLVKKSTGDLMDGILVFMPRLGYGDYTDASPYNNPFTVKGKVTNGIFGNGILECTAPKITLSSYNQITMFGAFTLSSRSSTHETIMEIGSGGSKEITLRTRHASTNRAQLGTWGQTNVNGTVIPLNNTCCLWGTIDKTTKVMTLYYGNINDGTRKMHRYRVTNATIPSVSQYISIGGYNTSFDVKGFIQMVGLWGRIVSEDEMLKFAGGVFDGIVDG